CAELVLRDAVVACGVADVVAEAVQEAIEVTRRIAGGGLVRPAGPVRGEGFVVAGRDTGPGLPGPIAVPGGAGSGLGDGVLAEVDVRPRMRVGRGVRTRPGVLGPCGTGVLGGGPAEVRELLGEFGEALADTGRPVAACEVVLHLLLYLAGDALHLLLGLRT